MITDPPNHPLDGCDPDQRYQVMMSERTALITARRESEDNLVKTIVQLASALVALIAGFISQANLQLAGLELALFGAVLGFLGLSIIAGLTEHYFASKAYEEQQKLVEDFYQMTISTFEPPPSNKLVRASQLTAFICFVVALVSLGVFALVEAGDSNVEREAPRTSTASTASTTPAASTSTASTAPTPAEATRAADPDGRRSQDGRRKVSSSVDAAATPAD